MKIVVTNITTEGTQANDLTKAFFFFFCHISHRTLSCYTFFFWVVFPVGLSTSPCTDLTFTIAFYYIRGISGWTSLSICFPNH
jgi:hypothetical protein